MAQDELISPNVRREARERLVGWTLREIGDLFEDHGFAADLDYEPRTSGERRTYVEQFYVRIDWTSRRQVEQMLGVFESILDAAEQFERVDTYAANAMWSETFARMLARDGFDRDEVGRLRPRWTSLGTETLESLPGESAIPILLRRMWDNVEDDPDAAIGAAKEAVEATAKHVILTAGEAVGAAEKMSSLISRSQKLLDLHASQVAPTKAGGNTIKSILGALSQAAIGINALRRDYGSGHGRPTRQAGLTSRHARLACQAADAWVRFMLDTAQTRTVA